MSAIQLRDPSPRASSGRRAIMPLDRQILEIAKTPLRPVQITEMLRRSGHPDVTTQHVATRLKALVNRDLAVRIRPKGGPRNGPGTSLYQNKETALAAQPGEGTGTDG